MKTLPELVQEIKKQIAYANDDFSDAVPETLNSRKGRQRAAMAALDSLFFEFRNIVRNKVSVLFVTGDKTEEFVTLAKEVAGVDHIDSDVLFDQLVSKLDKKVIEGSRENSAYIIEVGMKYLQDAAIDLGISSMPLPTYNQKYETKISTLDDAKALLKRVISEQVGPELQMMYIVDHVTRIFYKENFESKFFPIVVTAKNKDLLNSAIFSLQLLKNKNIVIGAGDTDANTDVTLETINEETVTETLTTLKQKLK